MKTKEEIYELVCFIDEQLEHCEYEMVFHKKRVACVADCILKSVNLKLFSPLSFEDIQFYLQKVDQFWNNELSSMNAKLLRKEFAENTFYNHNIFTPEYETQILYK
ncbi:hypothetical protein [Isobaculum melis]|uniref:Uncharacterized protein n=1 Tax=Isobaculum melis TaxID=142588 RepID=A0A1H9T1I5_9LACT|nr:hypothetical protein [Isobaculum melis]SER90503.1 hypothetical protein SAMN04488559_11027 [Isobaculum melis]